VFEFYRSINIYVYNKKEMGNYNSKPKINQWEVLLNSSYSNVIDIKDKSLMLGCWDYYPAKNHEYYNGKRFCKISRSHYRWYDDGWIWGRNFNQQSYDILDDYPKEISF
tara:strand:- start:1989 stop:2315 length:327 start_codon:yes stop_codon:yes gene_type:complete